MAVWQSVALLAVLNQAAPGSLPAGPLKFGVFTAAFDPAGTFKVEGDRWPTLAGTWKLGMLGCSGRWTAEKRTTIVQN